MTHSFTAQPLRIALVSDQDASDPRAWSGILYQLAQALSAAGVSLSLINIFPWLPSILQQSILINHQHAADSMWHCVSPFASQQLSARLAYQLQLEPVDLILAHGAMAIAELETELPLIYWEDMPSTLFTQHYRRYQAGDQATLMAWQTLEDRAFSRVDHLVLASDWSVQHLISERGVPADKISHIPFGANLMQTPTQSQVENWVQARPQDRCELIFIGKEWQRKGGPLCVEITQQLNQSGLPTRLTVIGCTPDLPASDAFRCLGLIDKSSATDQQEWNEALSQSHFLLMPSIAEGFGIAFAEASAYGVPSLARRVGGVPSAIVPDQNGCLFDPLAPAADYVGVIQALFADRAAYLGLSQRSRERFEQRLNWPVIAQEWQTLFTRLLSAQGEG